MRNVFITLANICLGNCYRLLRSYGLRNIYEMLAENILVDINYGT